MRACVVEQVVMNPFYRVGSAITAPAFARSVNWSADKWLEGTRRASIANS